MSVNRDVSRAFEKEGKKNRKIALGYDDEIEAKWLELRNKLREKRIFELSQADQYEASGNSNRAATLRRKAQKYDFVDTNNKQRFNTSRRAKLGENISMDSLTASLPAESPETVMGAPSLLLGEKSDSSDKSTLSLSNSNRKMKKSSSIRRFLPFSGNNNNNNKSKTVKSKKKKKMSVAQALANANILSVTDTSVPAPPPSTKKSKK